MAISYGLFFTIYSVTMAVGVFVGLLIFVGWRDIWIRKTLVSLRYNWVYVLIIAFLPLFIQAQDLLEDALWDPEDASNEVVYTNLIFSLSGSAIRLLQDRLDYTILTEFFMAIYAWLFTFLLYFAPVLLLVKDDRATMRVYAIAMMFNYLILIPFYLFFPVSVTGSHPESGATPLLYIDTHWGRMVTSVDPLNNDFPSGHVSLAVTTFLVFYFASQDYRRLYYFLAVTVVLVVFSVLYLGVHWPADVFGGVLVAVVAVVAAGNERIQMAIDRYVQALTRKLPIPRRWRALEVDEGAK